MNLSLFPVVKRQAELGDSALLATPSYFDCYESFISMGSFILLFMKLNLS